MLYALLKSRGVRPVQWAPGVRVGATTTGDRLQLTLEMLAPTRVMFDYARHRQIWNFNRNYVRLNE